MRRLWMIGLVIGCADPAVRPETDQRPLSAEVATARLAGGAVVESRRGDEPGESDLFVIAPSGEARPLAPAPGPDDMPVVLPDGRVAFVSGRTTVASIWVVDVATGEATQLTNRGLAAGRDMSGFVPTPAERMAVEGGRLVYETRPGTWWAVDLDTGAATQVKR